MASNFQITSRRKGSALHLKLTGDFDGTSAMELIHAILEHTGSAQSILVETDGVNDFSPFGQQVFVKTFPCSPASRQKLIFTGKHGSKLNPGKPVAYVATHHGQYLKSSHSH